MSTICLNIKRCDDQHVCIYNAGIDEYRFPIHFNFSEWGSMPGYESFPVDGKYKYLFIIVGKSRDLEGVEQVVWATDSARHADEVLSGFELERPDSSFDSKYYDYRILKIPFATLSAEPHEFRDLGKKFKLYCPLDLNEKYHVYGDRKRYPNGTYEFVAPERI